MSLQVWLPLNGDLHNQGLSQVTVTNTNTTIDDSGKIGKCYKFSGSNQKISAALSPTVSSAIGSLACWVKFNALPSSSGWAALMQLGTAGGFAACRLGLYCEYGTGINISINGSSTGANYKAYTFTTGTWYHICAVYDGTNVKLYINGTEQLNKTASVGSYTTAATTLFIGGTNSYYTNGYLNDVRYYNHALSPKEVEEIAKGLVLHYKLDNYWLAENILTNSSGYQGTTNWSGLVTASNENGHAYLIAKRTDTTSTSRTFCTHTAITSLVSSWQPGDKFTISGYYKVPSSETQETGGNMFIRWAQSSSSNNDTDTGFTSSTTVKDTWIRFENTYTVPPNFASGKAANFYLSAFAAQKRATVYWKDVKLEKGDKATPWCPAKTDTLYTDLGYNGTTIYDSSGYSNNGTIVGSLTAAAPSPRYDVATVFDGSSAAIKVNNNNWCAQGMSALTINLWAKASTWPASGHLFSCTESGGFNTESGNSGYWRFPVHVYTNAEQTSTAYKYDSQEIKTSDLSPGEWIMFTFVYDLTGTKTYLNGELHHTYTNTSYGIHFNMNARLFLGCEASTASPSSPYFNGQESDFRIYATALTPDQIKELYNTSMSIDSNGNVYARELVEL